MSSNVMADHIVFGEQDRILVLGGGNGAVAFLELLLDDRRFEIVGVVDHNTEAPGIHLAKKHAIPTFQDVKIGVRACFPCTVFNLTDDATLDQEISSIVGASNYASGDVARLVWHVVRKLQQSKDELLHEAIHDPLTDLFNRRHLMRELESGVRQANRYSFPYSVVLIDLDHFKAVNDDLGHAAGDAVLKSVAELLKAGIRDTDVLGRYGGEEFLVLLPQTDIDHATQAAEQWLKKLLESPIDTGEEKRVVSFSAGVACFYGIGRKGIDIERVKQGILADADNRLYQAKRNGRAQIIAPIH